MRKIASCLTVAALVAAAFTAAAEPQSPPGELPLPDVPVVLQTPQSRAAYVMEHFWDAMDFKNTSLSHDSDFMEQNFVNFISLFPIADSSSWRPSVHTLMRRAEADGTAYRILAEMAHKYLYEANSPMLNEEHYLCFLDEMLSAKQLSKAERMRPERQREVVLKNRVGTPAADFAYQTPDGTVATLRDTPAEYTLLIFYDPECDHCTATIEALRRDVYVTLRTRGGRLKVLAVYAGDREIWEQHLSALPENWTVGYDVYDAVYGDDRYILRAMPSIYLLDRDKRILLKDASAESIARFCATM